MQEELSQKAILICQKYEIQERISSAQDQLEDLLLNSNNIEIDDHLNYIRDLNLEFDQITRRINQLESRERYHYLFPNNRPFYRDPQVRERFGHIFDGARVESEDRIGNAQTLLRRLAGPEMAVEMDAIQEDLTGQGADRRSILVEQISAIINGLEERGILFREDDYDELQELEDVAVPLKEDINFGISSYSGQGKNTRCAICLCDFEGTDKVRHLYCDHVFHPDCIDKWFEQSAKCPICKRDQNEK